MFRFLLFLFAARTLDTLESGRTRHLARLLLRTREPCTDKPQYSRVRYGTRPHDTRQPRSASIQPLDQEPDRVNMCKPRGRKNGAKSAVTR
jgi:hypothetical protein